MSVFRKCADVAYEAPVRSEELVALASGLGVELPEEYARLLSSSNGLSAPNGVVLFRADEVLERNATFEVQEYAPGYVAIGDDSGGRLILLCGHRRGVWIVDDGSLHPDDMALLSPTLDAWAERCFPLD